MLNNLIMYQINRKWKLAYKFKNIIWEEMFNILTLLNQRRQKKRTKPITNDNLDITLKYY